MIYRLIIKGEVVADVEHYVSYKDKIFFVEEITTYGERKKGTDSFCLFKSITSLPNFLDYKIVGLSNVEAKPFWKKIKAEFTEEKENGDCYFTLSVVDFLSYMLDEGVKKDEN